MKSMKLLITLFVALAPLAVVAASKSQTVTGRVTDTNNQPICRVAVSDGHSVVLTNEKGEYSINTPLDLGYIFVSTPSSYLPEESMGNHPRFWKSVNRKNSAKRGVDFRLKKLEGDSAVAMIAVADIQVANRVNDVELLKNVYIPEINAVVDSLRRKGMSPFIVTQGDQTCDFFWYKTGYRLPEFNQDFNAVRAPVYLCMGNHDNDPYKEGDLAGSSTWHAINGPSYYSFNRGGMHFVVLDNIRYINKGGKQGKTGDREDESCFTPEQLEWLKADLAAVEDKNAPLFISMHSPLLSFPDAKDKYKHGIYRIKNGGPELVEITKDFKNVRVISGHAHNNHWQQTDSGRVKEYNYAATMGTWWSAKVEPNQPNFRLARDGSPRGIGIWEFNGKIPVHTYKGIGLPASCQMRLYDLNHMTVDDPQISKEYLPDNKLNKNVVLANIWSYEKGGKVKAYEVYDGYRKALKPVRVNATDPYYHNCFTKDFVQANGYELSKPFSAEENAHMFRIKTRHADTPVEVEYTDIYGRIYRETINRK